MGRDTFHCSRPHLTHPWTPLGRRHLLNRLINNSFFLGIVIWILQGSKNWDLCSDQMYMDVQSIHYPASWICYCSFPVIKYFPYILYIIWKPHLKWVLHWGSVLNTSGNRDRFIKALPQIVTFHFHEIFLAGEEPRRCISRSRLR